MDAALDDVATHLDGSLLAFDFDGTLSPIVRDPSQARPADGVADALATLQRRGAQIAIITGRDAETVLELSGLAALPGLIVSGLHGAQHWKDGRLVSQSEPVGLQHLRSTLPAIVAAADPDAWIEDKQLSLVVHSRQCADPDGVLAALTEPVTEAARAQDLDVVGGKFVLEVRIPDLSKADALAMLLDETPTAALFAGDDLGDLPAFAELRRWAGSAGRAGIGVAVGDVPAVREAADLVLDSPAELSALLQQLAST